MIGYTRKRDTLYALKFLYECRNSYMIFMIQ